MNEALFASEYLGELLLDTLGFTYEDFHRVREAIRTVYLDRFFAARDMLGKVSEEWYTNGRRDQGAERIEEGRGAVEDLMIFPGQRASFTAGDIAEASAVNLDRVGQILQRFSLAFGPAGDAVAAVEAFLAGDSPFRSASLIYDGDGNYITMNVPIGTDCFRQVVETKLKGQPAPWRRYERRRLLVSEQWSVAHLASLLGTAPAYEASQVLPTEPRCRRY